MRLDSSIRPVGWRYSTRLVRRVEQVINMICNIRDDCPNSVASALDNVLEALRSSELYAPHLLQHVREDKVVNDLVEGLMTVSDQSALYPLLFLVDSSTAVMYYRAVINGQFAIAIYCGTWMSLDWLPSSRKLRELDDKNPFDRENTARMTEIGLLSCEVMIDKKSSPVLKQWYRLCTWYAHLVIVLFYHEMNCISCFAQCCHQYCNILHTVMRCWSDPFTATVYFLWL